MKTPAGTQCPQYYADFHRDRNVQECRLASRNPKSAPWHPHDCTGCPVPDIVRENGSPDLRLKLTIKPGIFGIGRKNIVEATCDKHKIAIADPIAGCELCNAEKPGLAAFFEALEG